MEGKMNETDAAKASKSREFHRKVCEMIQQVSESSIMGNFDLT